MPGAEYDALLAVVRAVGKLPVGALELRAATSALAEAVPAEPEGVTVEVVDAAGVPAELVRPAAAPGEASQPGDAVPAVGHILYLHGGAYVGGGPATHRAFVASLARRTGASVVLLDYRLAPEHPYPAAVDDAVAAWRWLLDEQGADPARSAIAGDSAGGGLTAATLVALRDAGLPLPAGAAVLSPWADLSQSGDSMTTRVDADPFLDADNLGACAAAYLDGADPRSPTASPVFADLAGLPPLLVHVGDAEVLLDDSIRLAGAAEAAGVDVTLWVAPDMIHVWHLFEGLFPEAADAVDRVADWLRTRLR